MAASKQFLSLKWKAVISLSLVLFAVNGTLAWIAYQNVTESDLLHRAQNREFQIQILSGLVRNHAIQLQQLAQTLGRDAVEQTTDLVTKIKHSGPTIQLDWGIEQINVYDGTGARLLAWPQRSQSRSTSERVEQAIRQELPVHDLSCNPKCAQSVTVPLLWKNNQSGAILLARSIADLILEFSATTGADMVVLASTDENEGELYWGHSIRAGTRLITNRPLLGEAVARWSLEALERRGQILSTPDGDFSIYGTRLADNASIKDMRFIIVDDITRGFALVRQTARSGMIAAAVGLLIAEAVLLLLLWVPLARLKRLAQALPLLADNAFSIVRQELGAHSHVQPLLNDEMDVLDNAALGLTGRLESMQQDIEQKTIDLTSERDFVSGLLETAAAIILTQDGQGSIVSLNRLGLRVLGSDVVGDSLATLLRDFGATPAALKALENVVSGDINRTRHEATLIDQNGSSHVYSWSHSRLTGMDHSRATVLSIGFDITDRVNAETELAWLADHDPLTGLFNRRKFESVLDHALNQSRRYGHCGALLYFDLDQFKFINDTGGHQAGDKLLTLVSERLRRVVRETDTLARIGGDEFAILCLESTQTSAINVAEKVIANLADVHLTVPPHTYRASASIGIALFPDHGLTALELLANADIAMYCAKDNGPGQWHAFAEEDQIRERISERVQWKQRIEEALQEDRLLLHFQPILDIAGKSISHFEALVRMRDENDTIRMPGDFIPIAEQIGLIGRIDNFVLRKAIQTLGELALLGMRPTFSVNVSGRDMENAELPAMLDALLGEHDVHPRQVLFELTETAAVSDINRARAMMSAIHELGCHFALDDFGVGFSSFMYLRQLPATYVKIDGSFIRDLPGNTDNQLFVKALVEVARGLGKKTIAEFVEDRETLHLLAGYGVDFAQGYYIGRPGPDLEDSNTDVIAMLPY